MNKKGITMVSLIFYMLGFLVIISVVGSVGIYITKNIDQMSFETDPNYSQNQMDRYLRKFLNKDYQYEIIDLNVDLGYIVFQKNDNSKEKTTIRYYPESVLTEKGFLLLETKQKNAVTEEMETTKNLIIADNVVGLKFYEFETALGKTLEVKLSILKGEETVDLVSSYGVKR